VEEKTKNVTLVNSFRKIEVNSFPSVPTPMTAYVVLSNGLGEINLALVVTRCATLDEIYSRSLKIAFNDPLRQLRLSWLIQSCSFPVSGAYEFGLQANGELITQSVIQVIEKGTNNG
jgi:hypothetical protein